MEEKLPVDPYSHVRALRNADIKKPCREASQKSLRNRAVPPRGPKKLATYTAEHGSRSLSRACDGSTHSFSGRSCSSAEAVGGLWEGCGRAGEGRGGVGRAKVVC